ncbi:response regulator transcription factor [Microbacterium paraoxydans]|jgi:DNA-binding NarL/FixJ family response regulator|uniref:DNA-binding response regulator, NarL/FixJ family, contains REC and HTH domains n=1 Tax=Microbacterium paraoxydans TaxID=199592 RepID=A0A1H1PPS3_9MICO|nr:MULTISPECIES: response regulator transcription factor [Microbacterium]AVL97851.1 DNA-binding response regulator [Microbacterium sp. str. 'China']SDS13158.1 DNA-binding response regulator, NarL/FixJ family, contains REC and HTH domains [Microbacterium paraoxydans]
MTSPIRVLLVDDQELIRLGFRMVLEAEPDIVVIGEAADGKAAIAQSAALAPDLVLMDIRMPELDGIAATTAIVGAHPETKVLVLTTFDLDEYAFGAIRAGASGFLLKDAQRHEMLSAVRAVHRGDAALAPRVTRVLLEHVGSQLGTSALDEVDDAGYRSLTEREREVFVAIGRGLTNAEIAASLYVGESTVKTHVGRILAKLGARDRIHAVILAHRLGLVGR